MIKFRQQVGKREGGKCKWVGSEGWGGREKGKNLNDRTSDANSCSPVLGGIAFSWGGRKGIEKEKRNFLYFSH